MQKVDSLGDRTNAPLVQTSCR